VTMKRASMDVSPRWPSPPKPRDVGRCGNQAGFAGSRCPADMIKRHFSFTGEPAKEEEDDEVVPLLRVDRTGNPSALEDDDVTVVEMPEGQNKRKRSNQKQPIPAKKSRWGNVVLGDNDATPINNCARKTKSRTPKSTTRKRKVRKNLTASGKREKLTITINSKKNPLFTPESKNGARSIRGGGETEKEATLICNNSGFNFSKKNLTPKINFSSGPSTDDGGVFKFRAKGANHHSTMPSMGVRQVSRSRGLGGMGNVYEAPESPEGMARSFASRRPKRGE